MPAWYVHLVDGATSSTCRRINCAARVGSAVQGVGSGSCKSECLHGETRRWSAIWFWAPGICVMLTWKLCDAAAKESALTRHMRSGDLQDPICQTWTTAELSQWNRMRRRCQAVPQVVQATRTDNISLHAMG